MAKYCTTKYGRIYVICCQDDMRLDLLYGIHYLKHKCNVIIPETCIHTDLSESGGSGLSVVFRLCANSQHLDGSPPSLWLAGANASGRYRTRPTAAVSAEQDRHV